MKLLQINAVYGLGSTGNIVKEIDELAQKEGIESYVAYSTASVLPQNGYCIGNVIGKKMHALLSRVGGKQAYFSRHATKKFLRYVDKLSPDVVHLHNLHSNFINLNMLLKYLADKQKRVIITQHDCWYYTGKCFYYTTKKCYQWQTGCKKCPKRFGDTPAYLYKATAKVWSDRKKYLSEIENLTIVSVSDWLTDETSKSLLQNKRLITIHNGVDTDVFKPSESNLRQELGIEDKFVVLGMANKWLSEINKDVFETLIEKLDNDVSVILVGCTKRQMADLAHTRIRAFKYIKDKRELAKIYSAADVFVNLSREDTFGLVNIEALACGTPIIANRTTGVTELLDENTGILVAPGEAEEVIKAINDIKNQANITSLACRNRALIQYSKKQCYMKYINEYIS